MGTSVARAEQPVPELVGRLLDALPAWFGIPEANAEYVEASRRLPTLIASTDGGEPVGVLVLEQHFAQTFEIHLVAVHPDHHRAGVGRALVDELERVARTAGAALLEVKTLGPSHPDPGYAGTRAFYESCGFLPVEELVDLWPGNPCLLMVKPIGR